MRPSFALLLSAFLFWGPGAKSLWAEESPFAPEDHCLAYRATKKMFLLADVAVYGKSCEVQARMEVQDAQVRFLVSAPVTSLDSGSRMRDNSVQEILRAEEHPDLKFTSAWLPEKQVREVAREEGRLEVNGVLEVAGKFYGMIFDLQVEPQSGYALITGVKETRFSALELVVPQVIGGVVAKPGDELQIHLHLRTDRIPGF